MSLFPEPKHREGGREPGLHFEHDLHRKHREVLPPQDSLQSVITLDQICAHVCRTMKLSPRDPFI